MNYAKEDEYLIRRNHKDFLKIILISNYPGAKGSFYFNDI